MARKRNNSLCLSAIAALVVLAGKAMGEPIPDGDWWTIDRDLAGASGELVWSYSPTGQNGRPARVSTHGGGQLIVYGL